MTSHGVHFPTDEGGARSTTALAQHVVSDALRPLRPEWAQGALEERDWRSGYLTHFRHLLEAGLPSADAWSAVAAQGLASAHRRMVALDPDGSSRPAVDLLEVAASRKLRTVSVAGTGRPEPLVIPYHGESLTGDALMTQLARWAERGVLEPSAVDAVAAVARHPEWLGLPGLVVAALGAGSEMGPVRTLLSWGATVAAVDLPGAAVWTRLLSHAQRSAGTLLVPVDDHAAVRPDDLGALAQHAGADLLTDIAELGEWLADLPGSPVLGTYVYADGGSHVRLSVAADLLAQRLRRRRPETALAYLATPTDTFAVPAEAAAMARARYARRGVVSRSAGGALRAMSGGRLLAPQYAADEEVAVHDALVPVQGPNYAFAKRLQRWAATVARQNGARVSLHVAPATRTRSVLKNRALAAAYAGAHHFDVEIFAPETSNALMAALLVHDLSVEAAAQPVSWTDEARAAVHGGLWREAYAPRSALNLAAVLGAPGALRRR